MPYSPPAYRAVITSSRVRCIASRCAMIGPAPRLVAVDEQLRLLRVTTTVRLHGRRGRLCFAPVRLLHPVVVRAMVRSAGRWFERRG